MVYNIHIRIQIYTKKMKINKISIILIHIRSVFILAVECALATEWVWTLLASAHSLLKCYLGLYHHQVPYPKD